MCKLNIVPFKAKNVKNGTLFLGLSYYYHKRVKIETEIENDYNGIEVFNNAMKGQLYKAICC